MLKDQMFNFVAVQSLPMVNEFTPEFAERLFSVPVGHHFFLFIDDEESEHAKTGKISFGRVAREFRGDGVFTVVDAILEEAAPLSEYLDITPTTSLPALRGFHVEEGTKFIPSSDSVEFESFRSFVDDLLEGRIQPFYKTEEPVEYSGSGVRVVCGKDHDLIVADPSKTVFIEYYAPWCGHCQSLAPIWERLGAEFDDRDDIVIAKMDATTNEVPGLNIDGYPTLMIYTAGEDKQGAQYEGDNEFEALRDFVLQASVAAPPSSPLPSHDEL